MGMILQLDAKMLTMKKKFKYDARQKKIIVEVIIVILVVSSIYAWFNPPFLRGFADATFLIGLILLTIYAIKATFSDHQLFKSYTHYARQTENAVDIDTFKKNEVDQQQGCGDVFLGITLLTLMIGIVFTLIVIYL